MDIKTVAFIGLCLMGEAMCRNLAQKGSWRVVGYDTRQEPMQRLQADSVRSATSLADAVAEAEVVLMCLPGGKEVEAVTRGSGGLLGRPDFFSKDSEARLHKAAARESRPIPGMIRAKL